MNLKKILLVMIAGAYLSVSQLSAVEANVKTANQKSDSETEYYLFNAPVTNGLFHSDEDPYLINTKAVLGDMNKEDAKWVAVAINFVVGFGVGSFLQGDKQWGIYGAIGDGAGLALIVTGNVIATNAGLSLDLTGVATGGLIATIGYVVLSASRVVQVIGPFTYAKRMAAVFDSRNQKYAFITPKVYTGLYSNEMTVEGANLGATIKF